MAINLTSPITGAAQTGLTSPTFTITADVAPNINSRQFAVTALGGTQTGVTASSVASPFTLTCERPANFRLQGVVNPTTGVLSNVPMNKWVLNRTRKGVIPLAGQSPRVMLVETYAMVPAGADVADPTSVRSCLSAHIGALSQTSAGIGDSVVSGVM